MFDLKPLSKNAIPAALAKAERYRLLNEPMQAASICEDILRVEPDNAAARVMLILSLSDEFAGSEQTAAMARARTLLPGLPTEYERAYYSGILTERRALAQLEHGGVSAGFSAYEGLREAMTWFEKAEARRPADNDEAILRWNACARVLIRHPHLQAKAEERDMPLALEQPLALTHMMADLERRRILDPVREPGEAPGRGCMVKRSLVAVAMVCLIAGLAWPGHSHADPRRVTGMFSDMRYSENSGDVSGMEIFIVGANTGYFAIVQIAEGVPGTPVVVPVEVDGDTLTFTMPGDTPQTFRGRVTSSRLEGRLEPGGRISIRRSKSYWQQRCCIGAG